MGEPPPTFEIPKINVQAAYTLSKVQAIQSPYWDCMRPGIVDVHEASKDGAVRLHDAIRNHQRQELSQKHGMIPLLIQRDSIFKSFENQVLVSPRIDKAKRILVVMHDP